MNQTESEARFDYTVLSLEYCIPKNTYKLHCIVSGVLHTYKHLQTTLNCLQSIAHSRTFTNYTVLSPEYCTLRSIYKPWIRFPQLFEPAALSEAICPLFIYILFTQILGFCFLNVILLLY